MLRSLLFLAVLPLVACTSSSADEGMVSSSDAMTVGAAFTSSIDDGFYDQGGATLFAVRVASHQNIEFTTYLGADQVSCNGLLDVALGSHAMRLDDKANGCALSFTSESGHVRVQGHIDYQAHSGDVDVTLAPRAANAFVGTYTDTYDNTLVVVSSSNDKAEISIESLGIPSQIAKRNASDGNYALVPTAACPVSVTFSTDPDGRRWAYAYPSDPTITTCPKDLPANFTDRL